MVDDDDGGGVVAGCDCWGTWLDFDDVDGADSELGDLKKKDVPFSEEAIFNFEENFFYV